jgi:hypothetical protein
MGDMGWDGMGWETWGQGEELRRRTSWRMRPGVPTMMCGHSDLRICLWVATGTPP